MLSKLLQSYKTQLMFKNCIKIVPNIFMSHDTIFDARNNCVKYRFVKVANEFCAKSKDKSVIYVNS